MDYLDEKVCQGMKINYIMQCVKVWKLKINYIMQRERERENEMIYWTERKKEDIYIDFWMNDIEN